MAGPRSIFSRFSYASNLYSSIFVFCCIFYRVRKWVTGIKETGIKTFFFLFGASAKNSLFWKIWRKGRAIVIVNQNRPPLVFRSVSVYNVINKYRCQFLFVEISIGKFYLINTFTVVHARMSYEIKIKKNER